jgi:hypothetical protein
MNPGWIAAINIVEQTFYTEGLRTARNCTRKYLMGSRNTTQEM